MIDMKTNTLIISTNPEINENYYLDYSGWYLDGKLEKLLGYDKAVITGGLAKSDIRMTPDWRAIEGSEITELNSERLLEGIHLNGVYLVKVEGIEEPCTGYFWTTQERFVTWAGIGYSVWIQRGLVVLDSDQERKERAEKAYEEKRDVL